MESLIGLVGYAQSGKDSVANILTREFGYTRVAFADKLKEMALEINPLVYTTALHPIYLVDEVDYYGGWEKAKENPEVRGFLQDLGVAAREILRSDIWVIAVCDKVFSADKVVITDVRFQNEIDFVKSCDGKIIRVDRPGVGPVNDHISEAEWTSVVPDYIIQNDGSLDDLDNWVRRAPWSP